MIPQLEEDLLHLECSWKSLDQNSSSDGASRETDVRLSKVEDVVPKAGLFVVLHFGKVEVRSESTSDLLLGVVEEEESKVENGSGHGSIVDGNARFLEMPATGTNKTQVRK